MNPQAEHEKRQIIRWLEATMATTIGRRYRIDLDEGAGPLVSDAG
jgi:hypothetical protein